MYKKTRICECCGKELTYGSYSAWHLAEKNHSICKSCASKKRTKKLNNLSVLLEDTPESYYWIGFLLADGHFSEKRIVVGLGEHDKDHLEKFAKYINYGGKLRIVKREPHNGVYLAAMDTEVVEKLREKFDIKSNKTYNPPKTLSWVPEDLFLCLLAGIIDGDGCITNFHKRKDVFLRIKQHSSWLPILNEIGKFLGKEKQVKVDRNGYAELLITGYPFIRDLKKRLMAYNLPLLPRKWDKIDLDFKTKYEKKTETY